MAEEEDTQPSDNSAKPPAGKGKWYKEMIGPLPAGAWIAVIGAGLALSYWRKRSGTQTATTQAVDPTTAGFTDATLGNLATTTDTTGPTLTTIGDNVQWFRQAESQLIAEGDDPTLVDQALRDYIEGNPLTQQEQAVVDRALQLTGPLPQPPPPAPVSQNPVGSAPTGTGAPTGPTTNLQALSNQDLIDQGNFLLERGGGPGLAGDPRDYVNEAIRRMNAGTLSANDPEWANNPTFRELTGRTFFGAVPPGGTVAA